GQSIVRGRVGTPKSGRPREIPLGEDVLAALKAHRHLRGELVFCDYGGRVLGKEECKHPLWRACRRAGLRRIGWHTLRHTFASHLAMRGAPLKAGQCPLRHASTPILVPFPQLAPEGARAAVRLLDERRGSSVAAAAEKAVK